MYPFPAFDLSFPTTLAMSSRPQIFPLEGEGGQGCQMAKFDPFLGLCQGGGRGAQSKERKGSFKPKGPKSYNLKIWLSPSGNLEGGESRTLFPLRADLRTATARLSKSLRNRKSLELGKGLKL